MEIVDLRKELPRHGGKKYKSRELKQIRKAALHHSMTASGDAFSFAHYHIQENDWPGIGYHYVICIDGKIQWCHDLETITYHVGNSNDQALGICLVGDFRQGGQPTGEQWQALRELGRYILQVLPWLTPEDFWGHSQFPGYSWKQCPVIDMERVRKLLVQEKELKAVDVEVNGVVIPGYIKTDEERSYVQVKQLAELLEATLYYDESKGKVVLDILSYLELRTQANYLDKENEALEEKLRKISQIAANYEL
ncbi:MAG: peptidoglycan recognition family protein [Peptococcaceae bacterium]